MAHEEKKKKGLCILSTMHCFPPNLLSCIRLIRFFHPQIYRVSVVFPFFAPPEFFGSSETPGIWNGVSLEMRVEWGSGGGIRSSAHQIGPFGGSRRRGKGRPWLRSPCDVDKRVKRSTESLCASVFSQACFQYLRSWYTVAGGHSRTTCCLCFPLRGQKISGRWSHGGGRYLRTSIQPLCASELKERDVRRSFGLEEGTER